MRIFVAAAIMYKEENTMQIKELTDELKLSTFYEALQEQLQQSAYDELSFEKRLQLLLEAEKTSRDNKKIKR